VQSLEVQQLVTEQKRLVEERRLLKEQLKDTEAALTKAQVRGPHHISTPRWSHAVSYVHVMPSIQHT
jgi:hypothetical protein